MKESCLVFLAKISTQKHQEVWIKMCNKMSNKKGKGETKKQREKESKCGTKCQTRRVQVESKGREKEVWIKVWVQMANKTDTSKSKEAEKRMIEAACKSSSMGVKACKQGKILSIKSGQEELWEANINKILGWNLICFHGKISSRMGSINTRICHVMRLGICPFFHSY